MGKPGSANHQHLLCVGFLVHAAYQCLEGMTVIFERDKTDGLGTFCRQLVLLQAAVDLHSDPVTGMSWKRQAVVCNDGNDIVQTEGPKPDCAET